MRPESDAGVGVTRSFNDARQLINARLEKRFSEWNTELPLWARNLTDEHFFELNNPDSLTAYEVRHARWG